MFYRSSSPLTTLLLPFDPVRCVTRAASGLGIMISLVPESKYMISSGYVVMYHLENPLERCQFRPPKRFILVQGPNLLWDKGDVSDLPKFG